MVCLAKWSVVREQAVTLDASKRSVRFTNGETSYRPFLPFKLLFEFCLLLERVNIKNFTSVLCVYGRAGSFTSKKGHVFSTCRCSVYLPKAKFWGKKDDKIFGLCIIHLYSMVQVESECSLSIFHALRV